MAIVVTVKDTETGTEETREVPVNDYMLIVTGTCFESCVQTYPKSGTHVITIKGRNGKTD